MERTLNRETIERVGEEVTLYGWADSIRFHGKIAFLDLRDRTGLIQVVFGPKMMERAKNIKPESVLKVTGKVKERPENMWNEDVVTGKVELKADSFQIEATAETPPFEIGEDGKKVNEEIRMKYRYLDIRRERMQRNLRSRHWVVNFIRNFLSKEDFVEIETPILSKSTPEGARDYLVPSRNQRGCFYALPQSPQQYKQLLMVGGIERYFQFARCFRDEDVRADRQAEFTQLDMELSFVDREDVLSLVEEMFISLIEEIFPEKKIKTTPFPRISHSEAIDKWGTDRPDLREDSDELAFAFVVDFPMFEKKEDGSWKAEHHPFTKPKESDPEKLKKKPGESLSFQYDLVLNGEEIGGGSIRTIDPDILKAIFEVLGHDEEEIEEKFGHLIESFKYGVPPHGGIAFGLERFLMVVLDEENIREVMAFPKTGDGRDLMMEAPGPVDQIQLNELGVKIEKDEK